ncbi:tolloid-like protein 1 isoform X1 [Dermacentor andersoni]|uniref:tolloid-like protein 1 isoform X1 n=1 Tax=Dermacentor andersoni TaxID=34620 RepID=UPI0024173FC5|nr:cubilin-like isoform X1 [Dermacentor andersoni]
MLAARAKTAWLALLLVRFAAAALNATGIELRGSLHSAAAGDLDRYKTAGACDSTVDNAEGWILSPNYPSDYANFGTCKFTVRKLGSDVCTLRLTLDDFELEDSADCFNDYLLLPDGQKLCGSLPPDTVKTVSISRRHNSFTFIFSSNEAKKARGFMIRVEQVRDSCTDDLPDSPLFPTDSQPEDFAPLGRPQPQFGNAGGCDRDVLGYTHVLSSPGYPYGYPPNQYCLYRVWRADSSVCQLELDVRDFELNQRDCFRDYLDLPDGTQFCGQVSGTKLLEFAPGSETLRLKFVSDAYGSGKGFNIFLRQRPNSCRGQGQVPFGVCDQRLAAVSSLVRSPGYPRGYPANLRCRYTVLRLNRNVCRLQVLFRRFSLENSFGCRKDYLEMPDRSRICGRYAGSRTYDFNQDSVNLYFTTDGFRTDSGFEIEIRQLQNSCLNPVAEPPPSSPGSCDRTLSRDVEIVRSPSFPGDYPGGVRCVYRLRRSRPSVCQLRLDLVDFDVEDAPDCVADSLLIESTGERLCGFRSSTSRVLYFPREADELRLVFTSDLTTTRKGFEIKVTQSDIGCTRAPLGPAVGRPGDGSSSPAQPSTCGRLHYDGGVLESPRHPFAYPANLDCRYWIHRASPSVCRAQLTFGRFDVGVQRSGRCPSDYLEIQGTRYCGRRDGQTIIVDFPRGRNSIELKLHTDGVYERSGFRINVKQISSGCVASPLPGEDCDQVITAETFQLMSPGFRRGGYPGGIHCIYTLRKHDFRVCALEVKMDAFELEQDPGCSKDYLQFGTLRFCGKQAYGATRTIEFLDDEMKIQFHTNPTVSGAGFLLTGKQVTC